MPTRHIQSVFQTLLIFIFIGVIFAPPMETLITPKSKISENEQRTLASLPVFKFEASCIANYPKNFEAYYNDHFGFRKSLITWHNYVKTKWLKTSPVELVMIGKENWLYYKPPDVFENFQGQMPLTPEKLEQWRKLFEFKRNWLAKHGIKYLVVLAPDKHYIYPEYLPATYLKNRGTTRLDQILEYMTEHSDVSMLDLRPALIEEKMRKQVYFPTDLHMNDNGGFAVSREIIKQIQSWYPDITMIEDKALFETTKESRDGELSNMLGLPEYYPGIRQVITVKNPCAEDIPLKLKLPSHVLQVTKHCEKKRLNCVVFHDSMFLKILPFFSESFKNVHYIWQYIDPNFNTIQELMEKGPIHIVVEEMIDRIFVIPFAEAFLDDFEKKYLSGESAENL